MPSYVTPLDGAIIVAYFLMLLAVGLWLSRRASRSLDDYFLGGRKLPSWALGMSGMASNLDATGTMLIVSFLFMLGPRGLFIEGFRGGAVLILPVMMLWSGKWHWRSRCMTAAEWMIFRFGENAGGNFARIVTAVTVIVSIVASLGYLIKGIGLFLATFLPFPPMVCAALMIGIATIYTMLSGFYGVVVTDLIQSGVILVGVVWITGLALVTLSGADVEIGELALQITANADWTAAAPAWHATMPPTAEYEQYSFMALFAICYLLRNVIVGMGLGGDPKYFGAPNERACGTLTFLWISVLSVRWPMMISFAVLGLFLVHDHFADMGTVAQAAAAIHEHFGQVRPQDWQAHISALVNRPETQPAALVEQLRAMLGERWQEKLLLIGPAGALNPERILPAVLLFDIPAGLRGVLLIVLLAASMSTFDSAINQSAAYLTRDIFQRYIRPAAANWELLAVTYAYTLAVVAGGFYLAYGAASINDIWQWIILGLGGGLAVPQLLKFYWWRFNAGGVIVGTLMGLGGAVLDRLFHVQVSAFIAGISPAELPPDILRFLLHLLVGLTGCILGTCLTAPTDARTLTHFYETTRPFGFWGPLKRRLPEATRRAMTAEHLRDVTALPFALLWHITLFLTPMLWIVGNYQGFAATAGLLVISLLAVWAIWYRHLPPADAPQP